MKKDKKLKMGNKIGMLIKLYWMKFLAIVTVICGFFGSYIYYGYQLEKNIYGVRLVFITIFSTFKLYLASPTVSITVDTNILYEIAIILAPIYTASTIVQLMKRFFLNAFNKFKFLNCNKVYIYGLNESSNAFMENIIEDKSKKIIYLNDYKSKEKMTDTERLYLLMKGVVIKDGNYTSNIGRYEQKIQFNKLHIKNNDVFVLMNNDTSMNFSFLLELKDYLQRRKKVFSGLKCRIMCNEFGMRNLVNNLARDCNEFIDINTFDLAEIAISDLFQNQEHLLYDADRNGESFDIHMLIIGFGRIGEEVLTQAVNNGVTSPNNQILFDVFDKNMGDRMEIFLRRFAPEEITVEEDLKKKIAKITIGNVDKAESKLCIRFHICDIRTRKFEMELREIFSTITYATICFEDAELSLMSMMTVRRYLSSKIPIAMRMDMDNKIVQYISGDRMKYGNIFAFCVRNEIFSYERIVGEKLDKKARIANQKYEEYVSEIYGYPKKEDNWQQLSMFLKSSNRMQVAHRFTKKELLKTNYYSRNKLIKSDILSNLSECANNKDKLLEYIIENELLLEFAQIEHRRWAYFHLMEGYRYVTKEKMEELVGKYYQDHTDDSSNRNIKSECREAYRIHNLIISWKELIDGKTGDPFTIIYDLIPLIMEL